MLSHLCQARLWTRSERKVETDFKTTGSSRRLKSESILDRVTENEFRDEGIPVSETKSCDSNEYDSTCLETTLHRNPWAIKMNKTANRNLSTFNTDYSSLKVSENPAYGLSLLWFDSKTGNHDDNLDSENRNLKDECNNYEIINDDDALSKSQNQILERYQSKPEIIQNYTSPDKNEKMEFNNPNDCCGSIKAKDKTQQLFENIISESKDNILQINNKALSKINIESKDKLSASISRSWNKSKSYDCLRENYVGIEKKTVPPISKFECGSTFLSHANRIKKRVDSLPLASEKLMSEHEQISLWTENYLPKYNQNNNQNPCLNNEWYQLSLPRYQKLPFQKHQSPPPSHKISQDINSVLQKSSQTNPANVSMVIMQATVLYLDTENTIPLENSSLPMGSLVTALYKESDCLYIQTPHGLKGFVNCSNCMAIGILTDQFFTAVDKTKTLETKDNLINQKKTEDNSENSDSGEESEIEQPISMEPLRETNYSKLAKDKTNYINILHKNNVDELLSMISKHTLFQNTPENIENNLPSNICPYLKNKENLSNQKLENSNSDKIISNPIFSLQECKKKNEESKNSNSRKIYSNEIKNLNMNNNSISDSWGTEESATEQFCLNGLDISENIYSNNIQLLTDIPNNLKIQPEINEEKTDDIGSLNMNKNNQFTTTQEIISEKSEDICSIDKRKWKKNNSETNSIISESLLKSSNHSNDLNKTCICTMLAIIQDYRSEEEGTLKIKKGDLVTLLKTVNSEWMWVRSADGTEGYIPSVCTSQVGIF